MSSSDTERHALPPAADADDEWAIRDDATSKRAAVRTEIERLEKVAHLPQPHWGLGGRRELFFVTPRATGGVPLDLEGWDVRVRAPVPETIDEIARRQPAIVVAEVPSGDLAALRFIHHVHSDLWTLAPPVIALVSGGPDDVFERAYAAGAVDVVGLPVTPALLRVKLEHHARRRSLPAGRFGPFRIKRLLGRGVAGQVFLAEGPDDRSPIALKVVSLDAVHAEPEGLVRFRREIEALRSLESDHVPRFVGAGRIDDSFYCAMEFVTGENLASVVSRGALSERLVERLVAQVATALEDVHRAGLVHRDVKPSNVIVAPDGRAWLVDFGLAKFSVDASITRTDEVLGTAPYMAPEVARGEPADGPADAFGLGMTALEASLGKCPVHGSGYSILAGRAAGDVPDVASLLREACPRLRAAIQGLLEPTVARRLTPRAARELVAPCLAGACP